MHANYKGVVGQQGQDLLVVLSVMQQWPALTLVVILPFLDCVLSRQLAFLRCMHQALADDSDDMSQPHRQAGRAEGVTRYLCVPPSPSASRVFVVHAAGACQ